MAEEYEYIPGDMNRYRTIGYETTLDEFKWFLEHPDFTYRTVANAINDIAIGIYRSEESTDGKVDLLDKFIDDIGDLEIDFRILIRYVFNQEDRDYVSNLIKHYIYLDHDKLVNKELLFNPRLSIVYRKYIVDLLVDNHATGNAVAYMENRIRRSENLTQIQMDSLANYILNKVLRYNDLPIGIFKNKPELLVYFMGNCNIYLLQVYTSIIEQRIPQRFDPDLH